MIRALRVRARPAGFRMCSSRARGAASTSSQMGNAARMAVNARRQFTPVVFCERMVSTSTARGSAASAGAEAYVPYSRSRARATLRSRVRTARSSRWSVGGMRGVCVRSPVVCCVDVVYSIGRPAARCLGPRSARVYRENPRGPAACGGRLLPEYRDPMHLRRHVIARCATRSVEGTRCHT